MKIKLSTFEPCVRATLQGDGAYVGVPMVFVRMHGCDYSCSFCDTKDSWKEGSEFVEREVEEVAAEVISHNIRHVSITGGNPLVQPEALSLLLSHLRARGRRCLVESQASIYNHDVYALVDIISLSPKLHDWRWEPLSRILNHARKRVVAREWVETQIKVVVQGAEDVRRVLDAYQDIHRDWDGASEEPHYILLPEYSLGRGNVKATIEAMNGWYAGKGGEFTVGFTTRIVPQVHKTSLFVP